MTRLITYRFIHIFIQKILKIEDENKIFIILNIYLPHLRNFSIEWSYLDDIRPTNNQIKEQISETYYSIIKTIFSFILQFIILKPKLILENIFNLLTLSYESIDIVYLNQNQFIETFFKSFISFNQKSDQTISLENKLIGYNWFRFYLFKLCQNIEINQIKGITNKIIQQQQVFVFNTLILNELKQFKSINVKNDLDNRKNSLNNASIGWFTNELTKINSNHQIEIELYRNQLLILLLRCIYLYDNVRLICSNIDYIEELFHIYRNSQNNITNILILKILRYLISVLPETTNEIITRTIKNLLNEILISISNYFNKQYMMTSEILTELIYIYRTIISFKSTWQIMAIEILFNNIISYVDQFNLKSLKPIEINEVFASLCILGGYIQPYSLGSIVKVYPNEENNEFDLAVIIDINSLDSSYFIQYLQINKTEWISIEKLQIEIIVPPPNLFFLTNINALIDALGFIIEIDTSTIEYSILLELKRRSLLALFYILNDKKLIEIFLEKSYISIIAQLSMSQILFKNHLDLFNQKDFEQYSLSLDLDEQFKEIIEKENENSTIIIQDQDENSFTIWNNNEFERNPSIVNALSISTLKYNGWKPYASKSEIESFKYGRIGYDDDISIVSMPRHVIDSTIFEECGQKHKFKGGIYLTTDSLNGSFPTFIVDNLQLTKGKWYYCVRLPIGGLAQIGWATRGFTPMSNKGIGIGDDKYSWCYDGSRGVLFNDGEFKFPSEEIRWKSKDICGCGIEIDGENIQIKYWLNGQFLGTAFSHQTNIGSSTTKCNMLPHGYITSFYPGVTISIRYLQLSCLEFIFSPEDMTQCPLPDGYKPLLMPKLINIENSIVPYPSKAYLVGFDTSNYFHRIQNTTSTTILCDFINEDHLDTPYILDDYQLLLPKDSNGLSLSIDNQQLSLTISFDFELLKKIKNEEFNILSLTLDTTEILLIKIPFNKIDNRTRTAIVIYGKERQIKIYLNNLCKTIDINFQIQTMIKYNFYLLPKTGARIKNLAIWNYALSEEHIRRLFTYSLSYLAVDYKQLKEYRKQANIFNFSKNQKQFNNDLFISFNQTFQQNIDQSKYFKTIDETDQSTIQLFGNKTYLVLTKSIEPWLEYTFSLDISISNLPATNEQITLFSINDQSEIYITHNGKICLFNDGKLNESKTIFKLNEYMRLLIIVQKKYIEIYLNGKLQIRSSIDKNQFTLKTNQIILFREIDLLMNTTNDQVLRIECKSIMFLNRSIGSNFINEQMKSSDYSLVSLVAPPFQMIASTLIAIGYKEEWIKYAMKKYNTTNAQFIDTIIRENKEEILKLDYQNERIRHLSILSRLNPMIDEQQWLSVGNITDFDKDEDMNVISQLLFVDGNNEQVSKTLNDSIRIEKENINNQSDENRKVLFENESYQQMVHGLHLPENFLEWITDKSSRKNLGNNDNNSNIRSKKND
jgi:hypothetical protein